MDRPTDLIPGWDNPGQPGNQVDTKVLTGNLCWNPRKNKAGAKPTEKNVLSQEIISVKLIHFLSQELISVTRIEFLS
jgi:hypothetical protein